MSSLITTLEPSPLCFVKKLSHEGLSLEQSIYMQIDLVVCVSPYLLMSNKAPPDRAAADSGSAWKSVGSFSLILTGDEISGRASGRKNNQTNLMETKRHRDYC